MAAGHDVAISKIVERLDAVYGLHVMATKEVNSEFESSMILKELELLWRNVGKAIEDVRTENPFTRANWAASRLIAKPRKRDWTPPAV
jgi:hypothetical protein